MSKTIVTTASMVLDRAEEFILDHMLDRFYMTILLNMLESRRVHDGTDPTVFQFLSPTNLSYLIELKVSWNGGFKLKLHMVGGVLDITDKFKTILELKNINSIEMILSALMVFDRDGALSKQAYVRAGMKGTYFPMQYIVAFEIDVTDGDILHIRDTNFNMVREIVIRRVNDTFRLREVGDNSFDELPEIHKFDPRKEVEAVRDLNFKLQEFNEMVNRRGFDFILTEFNEINDPNYWA